MKVATSMEFDPYGLPREVRLPTFPLIGFTGLQIKSKKSHQMVWEAFSTNRRTDRIPLKFLLQENQLNLPPLKQKKQSYEWYSPKGILKTNWILKYLEHIPALIVLFWDLDWNQDDWNEQRNQLSQKVQTLKTIIHGRNIRLAVILMQISSATSLPGEDGNVASEKAASLCAACDLPPKHLFVLPLSDSHLIGYTVRLENALSDIAGGFYLGELKAVKSHKDFLNKTNHQLLFIRHQFKIAYHNEMRSDPQAAIKHYNQCYQHLLEHRFTNTNLQEIRMVASIVNYKICKIDFLLNLPRDAIDQFRKHVDVFRQRTGPKELIFEHYAWLSKQYQIFGEAFEEAVREGLPAVQTQHPGFYYQQAAHYAVLRRNTALQVCKNVAPPERDFLEGWNAQIFYGQRPWRPEKHSLEPPEEQSEQEGIQAICHHEATRVDHSSIIIPRYSAAINQFKKYRCPRIRRYLMVQMANEYNEAHEPLKALTILNHVMCDYRFERWYSLLTSCSSLALKCAYQTAALQDYLALSLEVMGPKILASDEQKEVAFTNLISIINYKVPSSPATLASDVVASSMETWSYVLQSTRPSVVVSMNDSLPCIEVRTGFEVRQAPVDTQVPTTVRLRNHFTKDFQLYYVIVQTDSSVCSQMKENNPDKLLIKSSSILEVCFQFQPSIQDSEKDIKIIGVTIGLGTSEDKTIALHWSSTEGFETQDNCGKSIEEFSLTKNIFDAPKLHCCLTVQSRKTKLLAKINYDESALVWEWLHILIDLNNVESASVSDLTLSFSLDAGTESQIERTTQVSLPSTLDNKLCPSSITNHRLPNLSPGESAQISLFVKSLTAARRTFILKIKYMCEVELNKRTVLCPTILSERISITSKIPFQISTETYSLQSFDAISTIGRKEKFLLVPKIKCSSHVPIEFTDSSVAVENTVQCEGESSSHVAGVELGNGEEANDCFCISLIENVSVDTPITLGQYMLNWKRSDKSSPVVTVSVPLPSVTVLDFGVWVDVDLPPQGTVRVPMTVSYTITNTSSHAEELSASMHVSDAFMFSGCKEIRLRILPGWKECLTYTLYPLLAGYVQLPRLCITVDWPKASNTGANLDGYLKRILPSRLFVMPQEKLGDVLSNETTESLLETTS